MLSKNIDLEPLVTYLNRLLSLQSQGTLSDICDKSWVIAPEEIETFPAAICKQAHLKWNLKTVKGITIKDELRRVSGGKVTHSPTMAYQINQAKLLEGVLYKRNYRLRLNCKNESKLNFYGLKHEHKEGLLVSSWSSNKYFGHWIHDECPRLITACEMGIEPISSGGSLYSHQRGYEKIFNLRSIPVKRAIFDELIVLSDATLNTYRQQQLSKLRNLASNAVAKRAGNEYVFFKRGHQGQTGRALTNENQLIEKLIKYGFTVIEPENLSVDEILQHCINAKIIMGVEGSAMVHALICLQPSGTMLCLVPEYRFNNPFADFCAALGLNYGFIVGKTTHGGFEVDLNDMEEVLEIAVKNIGF